MWGVHMVVFVVLLSIQGIALWLSVACNINTLPLRFLSSENDKINLTQFQLITKKIFEMNDSMYVWAKRLGVQQQWFLFDNPSKTSFWFRIVGQTTDGTQYDLHILTLKYIKKMKSLPCFMPPKHKLFDDPNELLYRLQTPENILKMSSWDQVYGSHRFRKFFQRLTDKRHRFHNFTASYANGLQRIWQQNDLDHQCGKLMNVKCYGCWIPLRKKTNGSKINISNSSSESSDSSIAKTEGINRKNKDKTNPVPIIVRAVAWEVILKRDKKKTGGKIK
jgi:hypothetical protein